VNASWTDATGNWTTPSDWSCNRVPNNSSTKVFDMTVSTNTGFASLDNTSTSLLLPEVGTQEIYALDTEFSLCLASTLRRDRLGGQIKSAASGLHERRLGL
jgi:hypothetical protein